MAVDGGGGGAWCGCVKVMLRRGMGRVGRGGDLRMGSRAIGHTHAPVAAEAARSSSRQQRRRRGCGAAGVAAIVGSVVAGVGVDEALVWAIRWCGLRVAARRPCLCV